MDLKIDFNNPRILQGHLEQALPQMDFGEDLRFFERMFVVGYEGGLAYRLFQENKRFPSQFMIDSTREMGCVQNYFNAVQAYVTNAGKHAKQQGFGLVTILDQNVLREYMDGYDVYYTGIGSANIESAERFQAFLGMIKSGKGELDKEYQILIERRDLFNSYALTITQPQTPTHLNNFLSH